MVPSCSAAQCYRNYLNLPVYDLKRKIDFTFFSPFIRGKGFFFLIFVLPPKISEKNPKNPKKIRKIQKIRKKIQKIRKIRKKSKKSEKSEKIRKIQGFFWGFKIRTPYLGVNNSSNSVFKSFFIYKILVQQKKISKNPKYPKKNKDFFEDLNPYTLFGSEQFLHFSV